MKNKNSRQTAKQYLRELSIVVVGITLTLGINGWINRNNIKKEHEQYLNTIKLELKTNIETIENEIAQLDKSVNYANYLISQHIDSLNADTIQKYQYAITQLRNPKFKYNAFEMFKSSGNMRLIGDKNLQLTIWEVYDQIGIFQDEFQAYYREKGAESLQEIKSNPNKKMITIRMYDFFITGYPISLQKRCKEDLKLLKDKVDLLEKSL